MVDDRDDHMRRQYFTTPIASFRAHTKHTPTHTRARVGVRVQCVPEGIRIRTARVFITGSVRHIECLKLEYGAVNRPLKACSN